MSATIVDPRQRALEPEPVDRDRREGDDRDGARARSPSGTSDSRAVAQRRSPGPRACPSDHADARPPSASVPVYTSPRESVGHSVTNAAAMTVGRGIEELLDAEQRGTAPPTRRGPRRTRGAAAATRPTRPTRAPLPTPGAAADAARHARPSARIRAASTLRSARRRLVAAQRLADLGDEPEVALRSRASPRSAAGAGRRRRLRAMRPGRARHHDDARRQEHRLGDRMGDEDDRRSRSAARCA